MDVSMNKPKILFDTNIILDWLLERDNFFHSSYDCIKLCENNKIQGFITPHSISDIYYLISKKYTLNEKKEYMNLLCNIFYVLTEDSNVLEKIVTSDYWKNNSWDDIEDSMQIVCAEINQMDYILTRNTKDFKFAKTKCILPEDLLINLFKN